MNKYIVYGIFDRGTGELEKVGRYPASYPNSANRIVKSAGPTKFVKQMGEFEDFNKCVQRILYLKKHKALITYTSPSEDIFKQAKAVEATPPPQVRIGRVTTRKSYNGEVVRTIVPTFIDEHRPGDLNGYLMYVKCWDGSHQIVKV